MRVSLNCTLTEYGRKLVEEHTGLAVRATRKWLWGRRIVRDDEESLAYWAAVRAAVSYSPARRASFRTWLYRQCPRYVADQLRTELGRGNRPRFVSFAAFKFDGQEHDESGGREVEIDGAFESGDGPVGWELVYADHVRHLARCMPAKTSRIFRALYLHAECRKQVACGKAFGMTEAAVHYHRDLALESIRERQVG